MSKVEDGYNFTEYPYNHDMRRVSYLPPHFIRFEIELKEIDSEKKATTRSQFNDDKLARVILEKCQGRYFFESLTEDSMVRNYKDPMPYIIAFEDQKDAMTFTLHYENI